MWYAPTCIFCIKTVSKLIHKNLSKAAISEEEIGGQRLLVIVDPFL